MVDTVDISTLPSKPIRGTTKKGVSKADLNALKDVLENDVTDAEQQRIYKALAHSAVFDSFDRDGNKILDEDELKLVGKLDGTDTNISLDDLKKFASVRGRINEVSTNFSEYSQNFRGRSVKDTVVFNNNLNFTDDHALLLGIGRDNNLHLFAIPYDDSKEILDYPIPIVEDGTTESIGIEALAGLQETKLMINNTVSSHSGPKVNGTPLPWKRVIDLRDPNNGPQRRLFTDFVFKNFTVDDKENLVFTGNTDFITTKNSKIQVRSGKTAEDLFAAQYADYKLISSLNSILNP